MDQRAVILVGLTRLRPAGESLREYSYHRVLRCNLDSRLGFLELEGTRA